MFEPARLKEVLARKAALRAAIATRRRECADAARLALRPLVWIDRIRAIWSRVAPWVAGVRHLVAPPPRFRRPGGGIARTFRWLSTALGTLSAFRRTRPNAAP